MNFRTRLQSLSRLIRYSMQPRVHDETVAEHSFHVAALVLSYADDYYFDVYKAAAMAVAHDLPEAAISDCPRQLKVAFPRIREAFRQSEEEVKKTLPSVFKELLEGYKSSSVESLIVHLADAEQCLMYVEEETRLGNSSLRFIGAESERRMTELRKQLKEHKKWAI